MVLAVNGFPGSLASGIREFNRRHRQPLIDEREDEMRRSIFEVASPALLGAASIRNLETNFGLLYEFGVHQ